MKAVDDPFLPLDAPLAHAELGDDFAELTRRPLAPALGAWAPPARAADVPAVARLEGFDPLEQPVVSGVANCPGEKLSARSTVPLRRAQIGCDVVLLFEQGQPRLPIVVGVIEARPLQSRGASVDTLCVLQADGERQVIEAESEVVLRCGDASITLTRAGKVIIKGHYILSRSSGINKIKGAAVDIN